MIDADLHAFYGIDTATGLLEHRTATWLRWRIVGLLWRDSALARAVLPRGDDDR